MITNSINKALQWIFFGFAAAYILTLHLRPYPLSYLVKSIPIFCLCIFAWRRIPGKKGKLLFLGFLLSGFGDIFLEFPSQGFFMTGMGFFTMAHLFYIAVFLGKPKLNAGRKLALGVIFLYSISFGIFLFPTLGTMVLPIYLYLGVICVMGISACTGESNHPLVMAGAFLFIISDSIIAYTLFVSPVYLSSFWVMTTYYLAQLLLALGAKKSPGNV
ncbi:MAG: lysoplasmalogenase [Proteobacteria bacterium]|nr:lysoplasmalogenase [Pseudomonadota bacterium]